MMAGNDLETLDLAEMEEPQEPQEPEALELSEPQPVEEMESEIPEEPTEPQALGPIESELPKEPTFEELPEPAVEEVKLETPAFTEESQEPSVSIERQMPDSSAGDKGKGWILVFVLLPVAYLGYVFLKDMGVTTPTFSERVQNQAEPLERRGPVEAFTVDFADFENEDDTGDSQEQAVGIPALGSSQNRSGLNGDESPNDHGNNHAVVVTQSTGNATGAYGGYDTQGQAATGQMMSAEAIKKAQLFELMKNSPLTAGGGSNGSSGANQPVNPMNFNPYLQRPNATAMLEALKPQAVDNRDPNLKFQDRVNQGGAKKVAATQMRDLDYLVPQGKFIHATLQTAVDSTLPGQALAKVTQDIYGMQGKRVLIPRGSTLYGEHNSKVKRGQTRIFVTWPRLRTPDGLNVELGSAGADSLGRAGLSGQVDQHFWSRFGNSTLLSLLGAGVSNVGVEEGAQPNASNAYREAISQSFQESSSKSLQQNIGIDDTIFKDQGEKIIIFVARDLDFSGVMKSAHQVRR